jgi:raffinose/stachyose/melibiose transport system permease protein
MTNSRKIYLKNYPIYIGRQFILIIISLISLFPLLFMLNTALKSKEEYVYNKFSIPEAISWDNFKAIFVNTNLPVWFLNSVLLTVSSIIISLIVSILFAYVLARYKPRFNNIILNIVISLMIIPPAVMIIPLFVFFSRLDLINNYFGVILIYSGLVTPFSVFLLYTFFKSIPQDFIDSASIDGCSSFGALIKIIVPLSIPTILALIVVNSLWVWNELLIAVVFLQKDSMRTLIVGLSTFKSRYYLNVPFMMMASLITTIPMIILYFSGQKYFIRGTFAGAIKE